MNKNIRSFNSNSDQYAFSRPRYPREFYDFLLKQVYGQVRVWDCACGNGQVSIDLVNDFEEIFASDLSENQINNAFDHEKIHYSVQSSERTSFDDNSFNLICVAQAFHWFNRNQFFQEVDRLLKPEGILAIFGYGFFSINDEIDAVIRQYLYEPIDPYWSDRNKLIWSNFKGVVFPHEKIPTPSFTMDQRWTLDQLNSYLNTWSAVKLYNDEHNSDIVKDLSKKLVTYGDSDRTVKMDLYCFVRKKPKN